MDARKTRLGPREALALVRGVDEIVAAKGARVIRLDVRTTRPGRADLLATLLGPTGNLRAPTLRAGRTLVVGFDAASYARLFT